MEKKKTVKEAVISYGNFVKVHPLQWPEGLLMKISNKRGINLSDLKKIMAYNIMTVRQLVMVTGLKDDTIRGKTYVKYRRREQKAIGSDYRGSAALTICHPFPSDEVGQIFILVDDKCIQLINDSVEDKS